MKTPASPPSVRPPTMLTPRLAEGFGLRTATLRSGPHSLAAEDVGEIGVQAPPLKLLKLDGRGEAAPPRKLAPLPSVVVVVVGGE